MQRAGRLTLLLLLLVGPACSHGANERRELIAEEPPLATVVEGYETADDAGAEAAVPESGASRESDADEPIHPPVAQRDGMRALVKAVQARLVAIGFAPGYPDGALGERTRIAIADFQRFHGLPATGEADGATLAALFGGEDPGAPDGEIQHTRGEDESVAPARGRPKLSRVRSFGFGAGVGFLCAAAIAAMGFMTRRRN